MSRWISSKDTSKIETNYEMLQKSQTYDMMARRSCRPSRGPHCSARALRPSSPKLLPNRSTCVTLLLTRKEAARACRVRQMAKWPADLWAFQGSICRLMSTGNSADKLKSKSDALKQVKSLRVMRNSWLPKCSKRIMPHTICRGPTAVPSESHCSRNHQPWPRRGGRA